MKTVSKTALRVIVLAALAAGACDTQGIIEEPNREDRNDGGNRSDEPSDGSDEPSDGSDEPSDGTDEPSDGTDEPSDGSDEPSDGTDERHGDDCDPGSVVFDEVFDFGGIETGNDIATDQESRIYVAGSIDTGAGSDGLLLALSSDGAERWHDRFDDGANEEATGVALDPDGKPVFVGSVDHGGDRDGWIAKYDADGTRKFAKKFRPGDERFEDVAVDPWGNIIVVGSADGDILVRKLDGSGNPKWRMTISRSGEDSGFGVALDANHDIFVVGTVNLDTEGDIYLAKLTKQGKLVSEQVFERPGDDSGQAIATAADGELALTGWVNGPRFDLYTAKVCAKHREVLWDDRFDGGDLDLGLGVATDRTGNVFTAGLTIGDTGAVDAVIRKLSPNGDALWTRRFFGTTSADRASSVATAPNGNVVATGDTAGADVDLFVLQLTP